MSHLIKVLYPFSIKLIKFLFTVTSWLPETFCPQNTCFRALLNRNPKPKFPNLTKNPRSFTIKLYTGEGNHNLVWLNFIRPLYLYKNDNWREHSLPSSVATQSIAPISSALGTGIRRTSCWIITCYLTCLSICWRGMSYFPEYKTLHNWCSQKPHCWMYFSDHGTPMGWQNQHGYGCYTFR